jgi:hypothetical protein
VLTQSRFLDHNSIAGFCHLNGYLPNPGHSSVTVICNAVLFASMGCDKSTGKMFVVCELIAYLALNRVHDRLQLLSCDETGEAQT